MTIYIQTPNIVLQYKETIKLVIQDFEFNALCKMMAKISNIWIPEFMLSGIFKKCSLLSDKNSAKSNWEVKFTKFTNNYNGNALKKNWGLVF